MKQVEIRWFIYLKFLESKSDCESRGEKVVNGSGKNFNGNGHESGRQFDKLIKLGQAEKMMRKVMSPVPSRPTLIAYIKSGILEGKQFAFNNHYYIFESSLKKFIEKYGKNL